MKSSILNVNQSATVLRFILPLIFMNSVESEIRIETEDVNMSRRPIIELIESLRQLNDSV